MSEKIGRELTDEEKKKLFTDRTYHAPITTKIISQRQLIKSANGDWGYVDERGGYHPLRSIDDFFHASDLVTSKSKRTRVSRRLVKPETFVPPVYENGKIVKEGYFEKPVYREYIEEVKASTAPAYTNVIALEKKERVIQDIKNHYQYHRGACTMEGRLAIDRLKQRFPETEGWKIRTDITVTDYNKYYHTIPIVAVNKLEGITELVDLHTSNYDNEMRTSAKMSLAASMFESNHPRTPPVVSIAKLNVMDIHNDFTVMQQFSDEQLSENFYNGWGVLKGIRSKRYNVNTMREQNIVLSDAYRKIPLDRWSNLPEGSVFTSFDIESDRRGVPVQVAAIKFRVECGQLRIVDTKQRHYYSPTDEYEIPGYPESFTRGMIRGFRRMEGVKGHRYWNGEEQTEWLGFFEGTLVGSNIIDSDLPKLFPDWDLRQRVINQHGVFDTRLIGETYRPKGKNSLEKLFQAGEHKSLHAFGFTQHDAMEDAAASAMVAMDMAFAGGDMSITSQAALFHRGFVPIGAKTAGQGQIENVLVDANGKMYNVESLLEKFGGVKSMAISDGTDFVHSLAGSKEIANMLDTLKATTAAFEAGLKKVASVVQQVETFNIHPDTHNIKTIAADAVAHKEYGNLADFMEVYHSGLSHNTTAMAQAQRFYELYGGGNWKSFAMVNDAKMKSFQNDNTIAIRMFKEEQENKWRSGMGIGGFSVASDHALIPAVTERGINAVGSAYGSITDTRRYAFAAEMQAIREEQAMQERMADAKLHRGVPKGQELVPITDILQHRQNYANGYNDYDIDQHDLEYMKKRNPIEARMRTDAVEKELTKAIKDNTKVHKENTNDSYASIQALKMISSTVNAVLPTNSWSLIGDTTSNAMGSVSSAMGNAFGSWSKPFQSLLAATQNSIAGSNAIQNYNQQVASSIGGVVQGVGTAIGAGLGGPIGAMLGSTAGGLVSSGIQAIGGGGWKARKQARDITIAGQQIAQDFNLIGVFTQLFTAPLALFNKGLKLSTSFLNVFGNTLKSLDLSINRAGLTGLSVGSGQVNARSVDRLMGNQAGSAMAGYEDWSSAQAGLFTMGQLDTNRVVASALLGSFNTVYANGGDPVKQQAQLINKLAANNNRNTAYWASIINPDLARQASMLQVMQKYKGVSTWEQLTDPSTFGMYRAGKNDAQMANMYQARFSFGTFTDSLKTMLDKTVSGLWNSLTSSGIFMKYMPMLDNIANMFNAGNYKGGWSAAKGAVKGVWSDIGGTNGIKSMLASVWDNIKPMIEKLGVGAVGLLGSLANSWVTIMIEGMKSVVSAANEMFVQLNDIGIDWNALRKGEGNIFYSVSEKKANEAIAKYSRYSENNWNVDSSSTFRAGTQYFSLNKVKDKRGVWIDYSSQANAIKDYYGLSRITDIDMGIATDRDKQLFATMVGMMYKKADLSEYKSVLSQMSGGVQELLGYHPISMETKIGMNALEGLQGITPNIIQGLKDMVSAGINQTSAKITISLQNGDNGETIAELAVNENGVESTSSNRKWVRNIQLVESATGRTMARYTQALSH